MEAINIFWFRRDLRLHDNRGLQFALEQSLPVLPLFIFDSDILDRLPSGEDPRVSFIHQNIRNLNQDLGKLGSSMLVHYGRPEDVFSKLLEDYDVRALYYNHDYEPSARERDERIDRLFSQKGLEVRSFKDQVIFEKDEIVKADGEPYTVFTPYMRRWKECFSEKGSGEKPSPRASKNFFKSRGFSMPLPGDLGFTESDQEFPSATPREEIIRNYHLNRDFPARQGTSRMGIHLRFGTVSVRDLVKKASKENETYLNELIWREFYMMILWHFPRVVDSAFKPGYDRINWRNDEHEIRAWMEGKTGYPMVDAGMRQLNETGYMHNRLRMVTASFLVKHLLVDWRIGEKYFADHLLDFELSSNNGGWQWSAGTGCDAAPWFRIFNPSLQQQKFDPDNSFVREWIPELETDAYPEPVVDHKFARERALKTYKKGIQG